MDKTRIYRLTSSMFAMTGLWVVGIHPVAALLFGLSILGGLYALTDK